ncbi:MAG: hypothetical protein ACXW5W_14070 [Candidatus Binatia bacterium]
MKTSKTRAVVFSTVVLLTISLRFSHLSPAASVDDVALLKSAECQKILVEGARKEGKLTFYTTLIIEQVVGR